eukprot:2835000-Pyramimonas_sp.AAC.1
MLASALFRHSALWAPWPRRSNLCPARRAGPAAVGRARPRKLVGMRAWVVAACMRELLGGLLDRSNSRPKWQRRIRMTCKPKSSTETRMGPCVQKLPGGPKSSIDA